MKFCQLGQSGLQVSRAGLGCNNFGARIDEAGARAVIDEALEQGITLFDTADVYGNGQSEEFLGRILGSRRHNVILASKFGWPTGEGPYRSGASRWYIQRAVEASLRRLGTDYLDLYQVHRPDPSTPIEETLDALDDLVRQGKVRYLGSSNFSGWQIADADWTARARGHSHFVSAQNEWSLLNRQVEAEVIPACQRFGVGMLPYFPLALGFLTGKYRRGKAFPRGSRLEAWKERFGYLASDENFDRLEALITFAEQRGHTVLELALSWLASQPTVASVIAGATTAEQVRANVAATQAWALSTEEQAEVDRILVRSGST